ncbi:selenocysteine insertion sequence-binding protein 2 isoform X2 [Bufo gargarizans]|uniref:selenocysteine insertion sequence-binding protein 2 isoform X2 n=1 Tax=Bufo gargarizans TaxID=30331 RepID=UPI001CF2C9B2|nr:selenocysteine insertion sequence-binding protein 2 isoform X2 [Bufo gargarizans]
MAALQPGDVAQMSSERPIQTLSWASKVKQPPKNVISSPTSVKTTFSAASKTRAPKIPGYHTLSPTPNTSQKVETEKVVTTKKRTQKKKSSNSEVPDIVYQEPPRFQDDEEFPDLVSSSAGVKCENKNLSSHSWGPGGSVDSANQKRGRKKSKKPVQLDLGGMLTALEQRQTTEKSKQIAKPLVFSVGSGVHVKSRDSAAVVKHPQSKQGLAPHNPLDSSAPLVKKGKQREVPKAKKPTSLKKIILKEREQRKQHNLLQSQGSTQPPCSTDSAAESQALPEHSSPSPDPLDIEERPESAEACTVPAEERPESAEACTVPLNDQSQDVPDATEVSIPVQQPSSNLPKIHSRRFREYCSQVLSKEVDSCVTELLKELVRFQDRLYLKDPVKAKTKRRLVMGLREVLKHLKLKKLKCVIISPNCEKIQSKGGLDDTLQTIINCACEQNVPFVFALNRKTLGRCVNKAVPVSVVGIFSYDGAQNHFHKLYDLTMKARQDYKDMITSLQKQQNEDEEEENDVETVSEESHQESLNVTTASAIEETDEPNYIKVWKRMLEEKYTPYAMSLEESLTNDMFNFHL